MSWLRLLKKDLYEEKYLKYEIPLILSIRRIVCSNANTISELVKLEFFKQ